MVQKWKKLGRIFKVDKNYEWMYSHAALPIAEHVENDIFKIYFSCRDKNNVASVGYFIFDIAKNKIMEISEKPLLTKGKLGAFDDSGCMASCLLDEGDKKYMFYIGWNLGVTIPFRNSIGLAISEDGGKSYHKVFEGPILDRTKNEPHFTVSCYVIKEKNLFKMWYPSCVKWELENNKPKHYYHIKYAESKNLIDWERKGIVAIDFKNQYEYAFSRPTVIKEKEGNYKIWYSFRGQKAIDTYRIGYAESKDGLHWIRKDNEAGIGVSLEGWDSEMICYPFVFDHKGNRYMLYNGNGYGKTGIGLAILEQD